MSFDLEIPIEVLDRPLSLVGLAGLNVATNPTHVLIWNSFSSTVRNDRPPLNCVLIENNFAFQQAKPDVVYFLFFSFLPTTCQTAIKITMF